MTQFLLTLHFLLVIVLTVRILVRDYLSPPARLAWFVILNLFPVIGSVLYLLFGEVDIGRSMRKAHADAFATLQTTVPSWFGAGSDAENQIDPRYRAPFRYAASVNEFQPVEGNHAQLMADADSAVRSMVADIDAAREHVHVLYYIWLEDNTGTTLAEALIRAAERGVKCRALIDAVGSRSLRSSELWERMRDAGVMLATALPINRLILTMLMSRADLRNHRKITVIDGCITYCGSSNSADPEFRIKPKYAPWIDIMLRVEGPVVAQNQALFLSDWMMAGGVPVEKLESAMTPFADGFVAQVFGDGPTQRPRATPQLFVSLIGSAESTLTITTPYFVPDASVLEALCAAAWRGVEVDLILPERNDSWVVAAASRSNYRMLLEAGIRIHHYRKGLLHAKTLTLDGAVSLIGSSNIDLRSFDLNYENNMLLHDPVIAAAIRERQQSYIEASVPVELGVVKRWSIPRRVWQNVMATVGPVL